MNVVGLWPEDGWTRLDDGHVYRFVTHEGYDGPAGLIEAHRKPDGDWCRGGIFWTQVGTPEHPRPVWTLVSLDPLHVEPSLLCRACGSHGFIRDGGWVGA